MDTPGNILRSEREKQNKSVNGIAKSLKIRVEYLKAIEENKFNLLPAEVYTKAYLRLYAETLGLEGDNILSLYKSETETDSIEGPETVREKTAFNYKPVLIVASLLIIIISAVMFSTNKKQPHITKVTGKTGEISSKTKEVVIKTNEVAAGARAETGKTNKTHTKIEKVSGKGKEAAVKTREAAAGTRAATGKTKESNTKTRELSDKTKEAVSNTKAVAGKTEEVVGMTKETADKTGEEESFYSMKNKKLSLKITATELTWISISIDGDKRKEWSMRAGDVVTVKASDKFAIKIGNAGATRLNFNNEDLGELGPHGKIIDIVLP